MSREHIPLESPAQDYIDSLRAELAESRAREAALVEALKTIAVRFEALTDWAPRDEVIEADRLLAALLASVSPAAKALLERAQCPACSALHVLHGNNPARAKDAEREYLLARAQKADEYREALRLADYAVHFGNCDPCSWDTDAFTKCDCGLFQLLLAVRAVLGKEGE